MKDTDIQTPLEKLRKTFRSGRTRPLAWRKKQLARLEQMLVEKEADFLEALNADLGKSRPEGWFSEVGYTIGEIKLARKNLHKWMRPERVNTPVAAQPGKSFAVRDPLGTVLIISPWNYPLQLLLAPLVGAIAAGNCAVLKPSEVSARTASTIARLLPEYLDRDAFAVIQGGIPETTALLAEKFDYIFYTGNGTVGRIIMEAASKHLTPITLELGGKSPCIVDESADIDLAAKRITWGKWLNVGQTCIAPDYVLVHPSKKDELVAGITKYVGEFYGRDPKESADYGHIINDRHFERVSKLIKDGTVVIGGDTDADSQYIGPTVLTDVPDDAPVMQEEIFGPVLPIRTMENIDEAIDFINDRPKPLALYLFTSRGDVENRILTETSSGGMCINDTVFHYAVHGLGFGGVGASGMGAYHGKHTFDTFTHRKSVLHKANFLDAWFRYPPYDDSKFKWFRRILG